MCEIYANPTLKSLIYVNLCWKILFFCHNCCTNNAAWLKIWLQTFFISANTKKGPPGYPLEHQIKCCCAIIDIF